MSRRSGSSLVEVLVAIFVMGLGLIALLTLFPIGMLRMMQAIHDDKTSTAANNAHVISIAMRVRNDPTVLADPVGPPIITDLFQNPYPKTFFGATGLNDADPFAESYAVFVDPIGYNSVGGGSAANWVGNVPGVLRRRPVSFATTALDIYRLFTLTDDTRFENSLAATAPVGTAPAGTPATLTNPLPPAVPLISRDTRYAWGYLLRRPQTGDNSVVDCSIVVFDQRITSMTGSGALPEYVYSPGAGSPTYFDTTRNAITIDYTTNVPPPIRPGSWLLDATVYNNPTTNFGSQHAYFYRVVSVEEIVVAGPPARTLVRYEVATPLRGFDPPYSALFTLDPTYGYIGTSIVIDGIAEVFEKGPARLP